jgi:ketosteroid isomerase-like protein
MSRIFSAFLIAIAGFLHSPPSDAAIATSDSMQQEVLKAEDAWRVARISQDLGFLERFYTPEVRIQGMDGGSLSKQEDIDMFRSGDLKPDFITHGPLEIRLLAKAVALVTGIDHLGGTYKGRYGTMFLRFTDVLLKRDGRWMLLVQQATLAKQLQ